MPHILIAEDEAKIASFIEKGLRSAGYLTSIADNGETALLLARTGAFDLVVLDVGLPRLTGFEVLHRLRSERISVPIIVLTARDSVTDRVSGLEGGANDYMTKPFAFAELLARIKVRLNDQRPGEPEIIEAAALRLDLRSRRVQGPNLVADLTAREAGVLEVLMQHPGQVLSRGQLLDRVWGADHDPTSNVLEVFIRCLRRKIGESRITTVRGVGYRLEVNPT